MEEYMNYEVINKVATLVAVAFGLIVALAWNQAVVAIFTTVLAPAMGIPALLGYAIIITIIGIAITVWLGGMSERAKSAASSTEKADKGQKAA